MKMRKLFAGIAAAATLLGGMALGATSAQADGSGNMSDSEIIAQLVNRYEHAFVMRRNLDSITNRTMEHIPVKAQGDDGIDVGTASIIIKQQARRIDELERANAELRGQIAATA